MKIAVLALLLVAGIMSVNASLLKNMPATQGE